MMRAKNLVFLAGLCLAACGGSTVASVPPGGALDPPPPPKPEAPAPAAAKPAPKPLAEVQKKTIAAVEDALNTHNAKKLAEIYAPDAVTGGPTPEGWKEVKAREAMEKSHTELFAGFPDFKLTTTRVFQKGDVVVHEWHASGTQKGDFRGTKASNKSMNLRGASVYVIGDDGLIKSEHNYFDHMTVRTQIGAGQGKARNAPAPTAPAEWVLAKPEDEKNVAIAQKYYDAFGKNEKDFLGLLDDKFVQTYWADPEDQSGKEAAKKAFQEVSKAVPDLKSSAQRIFAAGDYVIAELTVGGTQKGQLGPLKASNRPFAIHSLDILQLKDGKVVHGWTYASNAELMGQLAPKAEEKKPEPPKDDKKPADKPVDKKDDKKPVAAATAAPSAAKPPPPPSPPKK
jgi:steroid delta-isomerase-like uncharacterized protein